MGKVQAPDAADALRRCVEWGRRGRFRWLMLMMLAMLRGIGKAWAHDADDARSRCVEWGMRGRFRWLMLMMVAGIAWNREGLGA